MPFSYAQYPGNGSTVTFTVPFPYLLRAHVRLYYGLSLQSGGYTQLLVDGVNYSWTSATQVQLTAAPVVGQTLSIRRETPTTSRLVDWNDGSALTADALDTADLQNFYAIQEHKDYIEALSINPNTNVADGSITANKLSSDAVTTIKIQDQAVTTGKIADGAILNADVNANAGIVASKLSFTQAGTGAAARTVDSRLKDVVSVKDFGAVGDGTTNDAAAIQAAIDYAQAQSTNGTPVTITLPAGNYRINSTLNIGTVSALKIGFLGAGREKTALLYYGSNNTDCVIIGRSDSPGYNITEHSRFGGFTVKRMSGTGGIGVRVRQVSYCDFEDIYVKANGTNYWTHGFHLWDWPGAGYFQTIWSRFSDIWAEGASNTAFYAGVNNASNYFQNIYADGINGLYAVSENGQWNTWVKLQIRANTATSSGGLYFNAYDNNPIAIYGFEAEIGFTSPKAAIVGANGTLRVYNPVISGNPISVTNAIVALDNSNQYGGSTQYPNTTVNGSAGWRLEGYRVPKHTTALQKTLIPGVNSADASVTFNNADGLVTGFNLQRIRVTVSGADASFYILYYRAIVRQSDGSTVTLATQYPFTTILDGVTVTNGTSYYDPVGIWEQVRVSMSGKAELVGVIFTARTSAASTSVSLAITLCGSQDLR